MSQNIPAKLDTILVVDPICDFIPSVYAVEKSPQINNYYNIQANSISSNNVNYLVNVNSNDTITDRIFLLEQTQTIVITCPDTGGLCLVQGRFAFRSFPLTKWMQSITANIGNSVSTIQIGDMINAFERYGFANKYLDYSMTPVFPDTGAVYETAATINNPLGNYGNSADLAHPRGSYLIQVISNTNTRAEVRATFVEPIFCSPFLQALTDRKQGFTHLSTIGLQINWGSQNRLVSTVRNDMVVGVPVIEASTLRVVQYVPGLLDLKAPDIQTLAYNEMASYSTAPQTVNRQGVVNFNSDTFQLSRIPKEIFIFARPTNATYGSAAAPTGCSIPDRFLQLTGLTITFNGQTFLSGASAVALYKIARENGCNMSWLQWSGQASMNTFAVQNIPAEYGGIIGTPGCVLSLKMGKDIPLSNASWAPGANIKANLQISANFVNQQVQNQALPFSMYTIIVYEGAMSFYGSNTSAQTAACLSETDVLEAIKVNNRVHYDVISDDAFGGNIFSKAKSFLTSGKLLPYIARFKKLIGSDTFKDISKTGKEFLRGRDKDGNVGKSGVADTLDALGLGSCGAGMIGGAKMSKAALKRALMGQ